MDFVYCSKQLWSPWQHRYAHGDGVKIVVHSCEIRQEVVPPGGWWDWLEVVPPGERVVAPGGIGLAGPAVGIDQKISPLSCCVFLGSWYCSRSEGRKSVGHHIWHLIKDFCEDVWIKVLPHELLSDMTSGLLQPIVRSLMWWIHDTPSPRCNLDIVPIHFIVMCCTSYLDCEVWP